MFKLKDIWLQHELKPRIIHRLPGRLRLRIPVIKYLKGTNGDVTGSIEQILSIPKGIEGISADSRSGSVLIRYQTEHLSESEIIGYIKSINTLIKTYWSQLNGLEPETWNHIALELKDHLAKATNNHLILKTEIEFSEDVWK
jgi:hypothetical protein